MKILNTEQEVKDYFQEKYPKIKIIEITRFEKGLVNNIYKVQTSLFTCVLKQTLPYVRVRQDIKFPIYRFYNEINSLKLLMKFKANLVPKLLFVDEKNKVMLLEFIPDTYKLYEDSLLEGNISINLTKKIALLLAELHNYTRKLKKWDNRLFHRMKIDYYFDDVAKKNPLISKEIVDFKKITAKHTTCFIHADNAPKNILYEGNKIKFIDFDISALSDPALEIGYHIGNYVLIGNHNKELEKDLFSLSTLFYKTYCKKSKLINTTFEDRMIKNICLTILARLTGAPRANYEILNKEKLISISTELMKKECKLEDLQSFFSQ